MVRLKKNGEFFHDQDDIFNASGYTQQEISYVREKILFFCMKHYVNLLDNMTFNKEKESIEMQGATKMSTILESICNNMDTEDDNNLSLLMFLNVHSTVKNAFRTYAMMKIDSTDSKKLKRLIEFKFEIEDEEFIKENKDNLYACAMSPKKVLKRFEMVTECNTFDEYIRLYKKQQFEPINTDIDNMLEKLFNFD